MNRWVEFIARGGERFSVRLDHIKSIDAAAQEGEIILYGEIGDRVIEHSTIEPYEQVKQKIMEAEKVNSSDAVVEHFSREEYEMMLGWASTEYYYSKEHNQKLRDSIYDKLIGILKEEE